MSRCILRMRIAAVRGDLKAWETAMNEGSTIKNVTAIKLSHFYHMAGVYWHKKAKTDEDLVVLCAEVLEAEKSRSRIEVLEAEKSRSRIQLSKTTEENAAAISDC